MPKVLSFIPFLSSIQTQTKGKVEALARTVDRLLVSNHEFEDLMELQEIVTMFMDDLNHNEPSQALGCPPALRWREDKEIREPHLKSKCSSYIFNDQKTIFLDDPRYY